MAPYYGPGLGEYDWSPRLGGCSPIFPGNRIYVLLQALHALIPLTIIIVTTLWTFLSTRGFLRKHLKRQKSSLNTEDFRVQKEIYSERVKNLIGIFGTLLLFNFLSWLPYIAVSLVGVAVGLEKVPNQVYAAGFVLFIFSNVSNPVIQTYFRKELLETLRKTFCFYTATATSRTLESSASVATLKSKVSSSILVRAVRGGSRNGSVINQGRNCVRKMSQVNDSGITVSTTGTVQASELEDVTIHCNEQKSEDNGRTSLNVDEISEKVEVITN